MVVPSLTCRPAATVYPLRGGHPLVAKPIASGPQQMVQAQYAEKIVAGMERLGNSALRFC